MTISQPRSGFTLPVFACAAAVAALRYLQQQTPLETVQIDYWHISRLDVLKQHFVSIPAP
ncbi:cobalt-precorrin-5B (C(1))-methyltransferase [Spirulina sp. 06S082]|nr:cobalt-precorrin-5B (C(1))-methyltransferase [Spirulina sp. 06S082]MEA5468585.1 cobalt-precorrin-5B (C(1))-methyltransferase [Spirulina sp. 06S082]